METPRTVALEPRTEFRFETDDGASLSITLVAGAAEVFGAEMVINRSYSFTDAQQAVFTWRGCTLDVLGPCGHSYVASETPMESYLQLHTELEERRARAKAQGTDGPRVLVTGPKETGKSSLCRLLANYRVRHGGSATLVDLDVGQGGLTPPGCVAAVPLERPLDIEGSTEDLAPIAYWLGHLSAAEHAGQFRHATGALAQSTAERLGADAAARSGGLIINTSGWVDGPGYESLLQQIGQFRADVLVVIGDDRLHSQLSVYVTAPSEPPRVVRKLSKSGGVISRSVAARSAAFSSCVREYFYGVAGDLCPHSTIHAFDSLQVSMISVPLQAPMSALPIGAKLPQDQLAASRVGAAQWPALMHSILAVVFSESAKCDDLLRACVAGYVYVTHVDMDKQQVTLLAPSPLQMPTAWLLAGSVKWI